MKISNYKKGFTIIELIVVMAVFLFIIGAAIGIFISIIQHQKKVLSETQLLNQIGYLEEYMSKALRMAAADNTITDPSGTCIPKGHIYLLTRVNAGIYRGIKFINQSDSNACQEFFLAGAGTTANPYILKELKNSTNESSAVELTSSSTQINFVRFSVNGLDGSVAGQGCTGGPGQCGASNKDAAQPRVTVLLNIKITGDSQDDPRGTPRTIQTTVSQRNLNVK